MAAVVGAARTLQERWRELTPAHRQSFLELIGSETSRLAALIADVLDTSRIEAGALSYAVTDVDLPRPLGEAGPAGAIGQGGAPGGGAHRRPPPPPPGHP